MESEAGPGEPVVLGLGLVQSFLQTGVGLQLGSLVHCAGAVRVYFDFSLAGFGLGQVLPHLDAYEPPLLFFLGEGGAVFVEGLDRTADGLLLDLVALGAETHSPQLEFEVDQWPFSRTMLRVAHGLLLAVVLLDVHYF
jgi:hypothetical protein